MSDIIERNRRLSQCLIVSIDCLRVGEMEHRPEQHRGVAVREYEAIAVGPDRILGIKAHDAVPECVEQGCERDRRVRVSRLGMLACVYRKGAYGVDTQLIQFRLCHCPSDWMGKYGTHGDLLTSL